MQPKKLKYFNELDGIRGIAALMIVQFHFFLEIVPENHTMVLIKKISFLGSSGVSLFFVLSGFLISRILLNTKFSPNYFKNFYIRRGLRIFPLYYFFLLIFYFLIPFLEHSTIIPFYPQIWFWVYLQNVSMTFNGTANGPFHFWSLAVEEHFYLFWPFIIYYLNPKKIKIVIVCFIIIAFFTRIILASKGFNFAYFTLSRMDELCLGALLAILEVNQLLKPENARKFLILLVIIAITTGAVWFFSTGLSISPLQQNRFIILSTCYFCFIGWIVSTKENHWIKKLLSHKILTYTGRISYGIYVFHPLCFALVGKFLNISEVAIYLVATLALTYIISSLSYYVFEARFLKLKKRF